MVDRTSSLQIAVIGSGISGLAAAYRLGQAGHAVTLFEAESYFGGHTHTFDVSLEGLRYGVDTGFLVFNHKTYPNLVQLFQELNVDTVATEMSFSVKLPLAGRTLEWSGGNLDTVFAQRRNLFNPRFIRMLRDILRFNKAATLLALNPRHKDHAQSLGDYLSTHHYSAEFRDWYLLPMAGCIWSCPTRQMLAFPLLTFVRFCHNHGLLQVNDRPQWHTVKGGARHYVDKMLAAIPDKRLNCRVQGVTRINQLVKRQVLVESDAGKECFDHVVMAGHSDQSLNLLKDTSEEERGLLSAIGYQPNLAVLHTDASCLPENPKTWSAWNYQSRGGAEPQVCVHYLINKLQPLPFKESVIVSLNPIDPPDPSKVISSFDYAHPVFDAAAIAAQDRLHEIQGERNTWFAGAWTGYGFHEDGLKSGLAVARAIAALGACHV
ncbi:NAD(P)/FAD-dependent oxidoreductase [Ferrigenium sp. UT5]|uniref:NAD(P)/FAD-dependent oxidoreductase n=1 Tax=Ferrigenium sp. UT5 TaxID=3242105 RepID=UPI00354DBA35